MGDDFVVQEEKIFLQNYEKENFYESKLFFEYLFEFFDSKFEFYVLFNFATDESLNDQNSASNYCNLWQTFLAQL